MIEIKNLTKTYSLEDQKIIALDHVSSSIKKGEFVIILGQSGCGKSTLLNILGGMDKPTSGEVILNGENIVAKKKDQLAKYRREEIGMIFQKFNLVNDMSILENVMMPMKFSGFSEREQKNKAKKILETVGLSKRLKSLPSKLSGGQQQRVAIARALVNNPEILLCDEPTGNLDSKTGQEILNLIQDLNKKGHTIIMVTHNEDYAKYANRVIKMLDGQIIEEKVNQKPIENTDFNPAKTKNISLVSRFKLAMKNLKRRKLRFFLTSFGVSIGAMAIVVLVSFGAGLQKDVNKQINSYTQIEEIQVSGEKIQNISFSGGPTFEKSDKKPLNDQTVADLKKIANVQDTYPSIYLTGEMRYNGKTSVAYGESSKPIKLVKKETKDTVKYGKFFTSDTDTSVVIPTGQAKALGFTKPTDAIGKQVEFSFAGKNYLVTITGVVSEKEKFAYSTTIPLQTAINYLKNSKAGELTKPTPAIYDNLVVRVKDAGSVSPVKKSIDKLGYGTSSYEDIAKQMNRIFTMMQIVLGVVGGIALLVASLGITNTMYMSILERTKEIGIMKAIGARNKDISSILLSEAIIIGLFGGLVGLALGYGGANLAESIVNSYLTKGNADSETLSFYIPLYLSIGVVAFSIFISSLAGFLPSRRAAKLDPVNALREE